MIKGVVKKAFEVACGFNKTALRFLVQKSLTEADSLTNRERVRYIRDRYKDGTIQERSEVYDAMLRHSNSATNVNAKNTLNDLWANTKISDPSHPAQLSKELDKQTYRLNKEEKESCRASILMTGLFHMPNELGMQAWDDFMETSKFEEHKLDYLSVLLSRDDDFESDLDDKTVQEVTQKIWDRCTSGDKQECMDGYLPDLKGAASAMNVFFFDDVQMKPLEQDDINRFALINDGFDDDLGKAKKMINAKAYEDERISSAARYITRVKDALLADDQFMDAFKYVLNAKHNIGNGAEKEWDTLRDNMQIVVNNLHDLHQGKTIKPAPAVVITNDADSSGFAREINVILMSKQHVFTDRALGTLAHEFRHYIQYELAESSAPGSDRLRDKVGQLFKQDLKGYTDGCQFLSIEDKDVRSNLIEARYWDQLVEKDANLYGHAVATFVPEELGLIDKPTTPTSQKKPEHV